MKTKRDMLKTLRAQQTYKKYYVKTIPAAVCRGITRSDTDFFYSDLPFWSDNCFGWVPLDSKNGSSCDACIALTLSYSEIVNSINTNDIREQFGDIDSLSGQINELSESQGSSLPQISAGKKHSSKGNKNSTAVKRKKTNKSATKKTKK